MVRLPQRYSVTTLEAEARAMARRQVALWAIYLFAGLVLIVMLADLAFGLKNF